MPYNRTAGYLGFRSSGLGTEVLQQEHRRLEIDDDDDFNEESM